MENLSGYSSLWIMWILLFSSPVSIRSSPVLALKEEGSFSESRQEVISTDEFEEQVRGQRTTNQFSEHKSDATVVDELCRFHGDQFLQSIDDSANIDIHHELFDKSAGLVPFLSYNGKLFLSCFTSVSVFNSPHLT